MRREIEPLTIDPGKADVRAMIEWGTRLHGHLGPFLVAGVRMGLHALALLDSPGYFGLRAESQAGHATPLSCLNDGVQIGSGCTTGKGNLLVADGGAPRVRFVRDDGTSVAIELRSEIAASFRRRDPAESARAVERLSVEELFTWAMSSR
jgi:formylmethanofuran dehydrogenase subunit E